MIILSSLLQLLHQRYGEPCEVFAAGSWPAEIYLANDHVARVCSVRNRHVPLLFVWSWWRTWWQLRRRDCSPIYVCETDARQVKKIRRLLTLSGIDPAHCLYITGDVTNTDEHWLDKLHRFGLRTPAAWAGRDFLPTIVPCVPALHVLDADRVARAVWLHALGWHDRPLILLQPGNHRTMRGGALARRRRDTKAWAVANWQSLITALQSTMPEARILLCGAPQEVPTLQTIHAATQSASVAVAPCSLRVLFALCEQAHSMISVDSGPAHAAAALGLPLVVMFGTCSPRQWLARSAGGSEVVGLGGPPATHCVDQIPVLAVFAAWRTLKIDQTRNRLMMPMTSNHSAQQRLALEPQCLSM